MRTLTAIAVVVATASAFGVVLASSPATGLPAYEWLRDAVSDQREAFTGSGRDARTAA